MFLLIETSSNNKDFYNTYITDEATPAIPTAAYGFVKLNTTTEKFEFFLNNTTTTAETLVLNQYYWDRYNYILYKYDGEVLQYIGSNLREIANLAPMGSKLLDISGTTSSVKVLNSENEWKEVTNCPY